MPGATRAPACVHYTTTREKAVNFHSSRIDAVCRHSPEPIFLDLCRQEPRLRALFAEAGRRGARTTRRFFWRDWERIKIKITRIVGWHAKNPAVSSSAAFEVAVYAIFDRFEVAARRRYRRARGRSA